MVLAETAWPLILEIKLIDSLLPPRHGRKLRDEFPNGLGAQRIDKDRTRQLRSDAQNPQDKAYGGPS